MSSLWPHWQFSQLVILYYVCWMLLKKIHPMQKGSPNYQEAGACILRGHWLIDLRTLGFLDRSRSSLHRCVWLAGSARLILFCNSEAV